MRRAFAVLALLATSWPHAVVLECALGASPPAAEGEAPAGTEAPAHHAGHAAAQQGAGHAAAHHGLHGSHRSSDLGARAEGDEGAPGGGASCAMVMACGLVMIQALGPASPAADASSPDAWAASSTETPSAADLSAEPPPPRRHA